MSQPTAMSNYLTHHFKYNNYPIEFEYFDNQNTFTSWIHFSSKAEYMNRCSWIEKWRDPEEYKSLLTKYVIEDVAGEIASFLPTRKEFRGQCFYQAFKNGISSPDTLFVFYPKFNFVDVNRLAIVNRATCTIRNLGPEEVAMLLGDPVQNRIACICFPGDSYDLITGARIRRPLVHLTVQ
jgi:hypothetical protein